MHSRLATLVTAVALAAAGSALAAPFPNQVLRCAQPGGPASFATVADQVTLRPAGAFTVEAWFRGDPNQALSSYPIVLSKPAGNLMNGECSYGFIVDRNNGHASFRVTTTTGTFQVTGASNLLDGSWHHLAGVRESGAGARLLMRIDGWPVAGVPISGNTLFSSEPLSLGAVTFSGYTGNWLTGAIDEVRLWNGARTDADLDGAFRLVFNRETALLAAWHFDRTYPDVAGNPQLLDSVNGVVAQAQGGATLLAEETPTARGAGLSVLDSRAQQSGTGPRLYAGAVRVGASRDVWYRQMWGAGNGDVGELAVVSLTAPGTILGSTTLPFSTPITAMAASDSVVFCVKDVAQSGTTVHRLRALRVSDPAHPAFFGDSVTLAVGAKLLLDPASPGLLVAAGVAGGSNVVSFVDVSNPGAPRVDLEATIGTTADLGSLVDVARQGSYLYASFGNHTLRVYQYRVATVGGVTSRWVDALGGPINLGAVARVATGGGRLYVAGEDSWFRIYSLTSPSAPALLSTSSEVRAYATDVSADGDQFVIAGPNGVSWIDASQPTVPKRTGFWCGDLASQGSPSVTFRGGVIGLTASLGGYTVLAPTSVTAVETPALPAFGRLAAWPNPSRGAVTFDLGRSRPGPAMLEIRDVAGRRVRRLLVEGGTKPVWDGRAEDGGAVPAGVYLASIDAGGRIERAHVTVVR